MQTEPTTPAALPCAPSQAEWDALTPAQRARVVDALPAWLTDAELSPPEGDPHQDACIGARDALREYFHRLGRRAYVGVDLVVYYPASPRFAPDLLVVFDVEPGPRHRWMVSHEGKGLDFVLEVVDRGDRRKDLDHNVVRYAELGIPEYFVYDLGRRRLHGYRLAPVANDVGPTGGRYLPIVPQHGRFVSEVLRLELALEGSRLLFLHGSAALPTPQELAERLQRAMDSMTTQMALEAQARQEAEAAQQAEAQARQAEAEARQAAERRLAEVLAELERLKQR